MPSSPVIVHTQYLMKLSRAWVHRGLILPTLVLSLILGSGASVALAEDPTPTPPPALIQGGPDEPCGQGVLHIRDLDGADDSFSAGVDAATKQAQAWQKDARLYSLQLSCPLLQGGYNWSGVFFSETAQTFFRTDTYESDAATYQPSLIPTLDPTRVSFSAIYRSLLKAGFDDSMQIDPANGVTVKENTDAIPFGPSNAPKGKVFAHLAIVDRNETKDVWVDVVDGTVYRYEV